MNQFFKFSCCFLAAGLILFLQLGAQAASLWNPTGNNFNSPGNWNPAAADGVDLILDGTVAAQLDDTCSFTPNNLTIGSSANGWLDINGGGSLTLAGMMELGPVASNATVNMSGNAQLSIGNLKANLADTGGGISNFIMSGTSGATVRNTSTLTLLNRSGQLNLLLKGGSTFNANSSTYTDFGFETDGTTVSSGTTIVTVQDTATLNMGIPIIGDSGSSDCLRVTGGTANFTGTADVKYVGLFSGYGEVSVSGGTVNAAPGAYSISFALGGWNWMSSYGGRGVLTVSESGVIDSTGAFISAAGGSVVNVGAAGTGGGTLHCEGIDGLGGPPMGTVNFHGGEFKSTNTAFDGWLGSSGTLNVFSEGAIFDVAGGTTSIQGSLVAPAGKGVTALEVTAGGSGYVTAPLVKITTASGAGADVTAVATISGGVVTGITITNPGTNYIDSSTLNVQLLGGGGTGAVAGAAGVVTLTDGVNLADNASGGLTKKGAGALALNANCTYTGATTVEAGKLTLNGIDFASPSILVKNTGTLVGFTSETATSFYPATTVQSGGSVVSADLGKFFYLDSLNLEGNSNLSFAVDALGNSSQIWIDKNVSRVGTDPITVNVSYTGELVTDATVLQIVGGGTIDGGITFDLPGGKPALDSDDGIHAPATVFTDYAAGNVQLKAGGLLADIVPAWNAMGGGNWDDNGKWGTAPSTTPPNPYPTTGGDRAMFTNAFDPNSAVAISLNVSPTLSSMIFASPNNESYTITASDSAKSITLDSGIAKDWHITVLGGSHAVNADIKMAAGAGGAVIKVPVLSQLTLGGALGNESSAAGFTFQSNGTLTGNQWDNTMTITHGVLTLGGDSSFTGPVVMAGYGRLELGMPGSLGTGTANFTLDGQLAYIGAPAAPTTVMIDRSLTFAGASYLDGIEVQSANVNLKFTGALNTVSAANAFRKTGVGTLTFSNAGENTLASGDFQVEEGAVVFENGVFNKARVNITFQNGSGDFFVGDTAGKSASLTLQNGAVLNNQGEFTLGISGGGGNMTLTDNSQAAFALLTKIGVTGGSAILNLGGTSSTQFSKLTCGEAVWFGVDTGETPEDPGPHPTHAVLNMTGYAELHTAANNAIANTHFGNGVGSTATVTMSGHSKFFCEADVDGGHQGRGLFDVGDVGSMAEITLNDFASISAPKAQVKIGANLAGWIGGAKGTVTLNGSAAFTTGNTVLVGEGKGDATTAAEGVINLNGGTFTAPALVTGDTSIAATINFNGGTLQACVPNGVLYYTDIGITMTANGAADFIQGSNFAVNVMENGAKIDTNALDITINRELKHAGTLPLDGGLTKLGDGSLTLTVLPTYTGDTNVNQGLLNANAGISTPNSRVYVATGATLNATSIVADTLTIGGPQIGAAVAVPEPGTLVLLALASMGILLAVWRRK